MIQEALLALDVGTSGCRAEVFALDGRSLGRHYVEYGLQSPVPGAAEQQAEDWWRAVVECTRQALVFCRAGTCATPGAGRSPRPTGETALLRIRAIGLSVQGHSWVPVDANMTPLRPALTWLDARAGEHARRLLEDHPLDFWGAHAGKQPGQWHLLPQLLWLRET